ncbi:hypothetical protein HPB52_017921 [Rhipicephalus sanguineus]|uniref:CCHC-type domain-containing protein n=1 Tax=Rhipicephalus sanguineus TaxID=34632 RepID=A0A9D4PG11_RHISA|nr:hypothetical protein HPB52_017921 [Rhipicephalus sanguineus]
MVAEGFHVNNERVAVEAVGPPFTFVNVYRFTAYIPDEILTNALSQYGKVKSVTFATVASRQNNLNEVRVVKMQMSKPVPNLTTIAGHRIICEYRGMRRVCARCGDVGHMATACSAEFCKRCGIFCHDTVGCEAECKRCGGRHGTKECFRKRSYVAAARGFPASNSDQASRTAPPNAQTSSSGLQVLKPRTPPLSAKKAPNYWDNEVDPTADSETDPSSTENSRDSWPEHQSGEEEQEVPENAMRPDGYAHSPPPPRVDDESFPPLPPGNSLVCNPDETPIVGCGRYVIPADHAYVRPVISPGPSHPASASASQERVATTTSTPQPALEQRHRSRSRRRQGGGDSRATAERSGSADNNLRRSKAADGSSDSEAARPAKSKKARKGSVGDGSPTPRGDTPWSKAGPTYRAKELVKVLRHLKLTDVWLHVHNDLFAPRRTSRTTASRIDRAYLPYYLLPSVAECEVLALPSTLAGWTDHFPLTIRLRGSAGPCNDNLEWRLDPTLLEDEISVERIKDRLRETLRYASPMTPQVWDTMKEAWKSILQEEGRARKRRLTDQMNELLRRMRIVRGAETLTACTRNYLDCLEASYARLLKKKTRKPVEAAGQSFEPPK